MDLISIGFYAVVCGVLGAVSPALKSLPARLGTGAIIGVVAAIVLPMLRSNIGY